MTLILQLLPVDVLQHGRVLLLLFSCWPVGKLGLSAQISSWPFTNISHAHSERDSQGVMIVSNIMKIVFAFKFI